MKTFIVLSALVAIAAAGLDFHPDYVRKPLPDGRIVGGKDADIADFPYQVSMLKNNRHNCGGAIIAKNWIITAAHCLQGYITNSMITFRIGSSVHNKGGKVVKTAKFFNHPNFSMRTMKNDVALVKTETDMFGDNVEIIGLPNVNDRVVKGKTAIVSGWGYLQDGDYVTPSNLQYAQVIVVDHDVCKKKLQLFGGVDETMFCAADNGKDACQGDSGGPIIVGDKLVGVVSWGIGCADPAYPGVYALLSNPETRNWVKKISGI